MATELFKKYYVRLAREGFLKALLCCLIVGFSSVLLVASVIYWAVGNQKLLWLSIVIGIAVAGGTLPLFYYLRFRPTDKMLMQRIDEVGLEERMITMKQLEGDDSYMARRQREDALEALKRVDAKFLKFVVSVPLIIAVSIVAVASVGTTTVYAFAEKSGKEYIQETIKEIEKEKLPEYEIIYDVYGDGEIEGEMIQIIKQGEASEEVCAMPLEGWAFYCWIERDYAEWMSDSEGTLAPPLQPTEEEKNPYHHFENVQKDVVYVAYFVEVGEPDPNDEENDKSGEPDEPNLEDLPKDDPSQNKPDQNQKPDQNRNDPSNKVYDGETDAGDEMGAAGDQASSQVSGNPNLGGDLGDTIGGYFGAFN